MKRCQVEPCTKLPFLMETLSLRKNSREIPRSWSVNRRITGCGGGYNNYAGI